MKWYYALNGQQMGPVSDEELASLVTSGLVTDQTLVWREGMVNWQPYAEVKSTAPTPTAIPPAAPATQGDQVVCAECGKLFPRDQTIQLGTALICAGCKPIRVQKMKEGMVGVVPGAVNYASFWIRLAAKFIDWLAVGIVIGIPSFLLLFGRMSKLEAGRQSPVEFLVAQLVIQFLSIAITVGYNTYLVGRYGATLGKLAVGIRIVTAENEPLTYLRAFGRAWAEMLSQMTCYIGYIIAGFDERRRTLHDHICNTRVVLK
jgi:uncharacterized RDD family membrane protein YckC